MQFMPKTNYAVNVNKNYKTNWINNIYHTNIIGYIDGQHAILETIFKPIYF